jgi:tetratricopeptide (TPR) repeat protein
MWRDHPWWGVGPGLFDVNFNAYRPQTMPMRAGWAHCDYLNLLTDWGLAGGLLALAGAGLVLAGVAQTWGRVRRSETDFGRTLSNRFAFFLGALGGLAALAAHCLVDFILHVPADALVAVTLLALLSSNLRFATERYWHNLRLPVKALATLVLAAGMGYLGWQEYRLGHEAAGLARADQIPEYSPARARALQTAWAYEPMNSVTAYELGECYRVTGFADATNSPALLDTAMRWYQRSAQLNPHWEMPWLREGNTLDFLEQYDQAGPLYHEADLRDPNGYYVAANLGVHYLGQRNFTAARIWLLRSLDLRRKDNAIAEKCMPVVDQELFIDAGNLR